MSVTKASAGLFSPASASRGSKRKKGATHPSRLAAAAIVCLTAVLPARAAGILHCPPDSVKVGGTCVDKYEASVWQINPANLTLVLKVLSGRVTLADLAAGGARLVSSPFCSATGFPANFPENGNWTPVPGSNPPSPGIYALSVPGVNPSRCVTWFQANQACLLSGKRLLTNQEWQGAAAGTPDLPDDGSTTCVTSSVGPGETGSRAGCKSGWGAFDMIGNVSEWVGDWADRSVGCTSWLGEFGGDFSCFGGPGDSETSSNLSLPGALIRGGGAFDSTDAGVFAVDSGTDPSLRGPTTGFRCAR
jgi:Sulfatase-modifying factor enzyme 1